MQICNDNRSSKWCWEGKLLCCSLSLCQPTGSNRQRNNAYKNSIWKKRISFAYRNIWHEHVFVLKPNFINKFIYYSIYNNVIKLSLSLCTQKFGSLFTFLCMNNFHFTFMSKLFSHSHQTQLTLFSLDNIQNIDIYTRKMHSKPFWQRTNLLSSSNKSMTISHVYLKWVVSKKNTHTHIVAHITFDVIFLVRNHFEIT